MAGNRVGLDELEDFFRAAALRPSVAEPTTDFASLFGNRMMPRA